MRDLLILQLAFDILILSALLVLARSSLRRRRPHRGELQQQKAAPAREAKAVPHPREAPAPVPASPGLDELVERAERQELVAEQALRARLGRFKARVAG